MLRASLANFKLITSIVSDIHRYEMTLFWGFRDQIYQSVELKKINFVIKM